MPEPMTALEAQRLQDRLGALYLEGWNDTVTLGRMSRARRRITEKREIRRKLAAAGISAVRPMNCPPQADR